MNRELIIVPYDFTSVGDAALKYALYLAKPKKSEVLLLHVISNKENNQDALERLEIVIGNLDLEVGSGKVRAKVVTGTIFEDIPKVATEENANLIVMGTHGALGMQKLFGSYAMKIISSTDVPFLIVQDGVDRREIEKILVPITTTKESLQVIHMAAKMAVDFNSKIHVFTEELSDPRLKSRQGIYLKVIEKQFEEMAINFQIDVVKLDKSFQKSIIQYAKENDFDMIAVSHHTESILPQLERFTQGLITNDVNIPCLVLNAKSLNSFYF